MEVYVKGDPQNISMTDLTQKIEVIQEMLKKRRNTQSVDACFLDGLAVATDIIIASVEYHEVTEARLTQLIKILQIGREGPNSYPTNRPAGDKTPIKKVT